MRGEVGIVRHSMAMESVWDYVAVTRDLVGLLNGDPGRWAGSADRSRVVTGHGTVGSPPMARIYLSPPHPSGRELEFVRDAIESNWLAPLGPHVDAFERELAAVAERPERARALERDGGASPRARRARDRRRATRSSAPPSRSRRARTRFVYTRRDTGLRRLRRRQLDDRSRAARRGPRRPTAARCAGSRRPRRRSLRPVLRLRRGSRRSATAHGVVLAPGRRRVARRDLPGRTVRRPGTARGASRSTATRSSRRAAAACSSRRDGS